MPEFDKYKQKLANFIQSELGGTLKIKRLLSDQSRWTRGAGWENKLEFDILTLQNSPQKGMTTYVTLGLSDYVLRDDQNNRKPRRIELISILRDDTDFLELTGNPEDQLNFYEDSLMYICCYMVEENSYLFPGDIWVNWFSNKYQQFSDLEHLYFMYPTLLTDKIRTTTIEDKEIEWLLCIPISQDELEYYEKNGSEALEKLLLQEKVDVSDLFRESLL